ncbi:GIY-YIG nuclease family protein [Psychroflexus planctonicus]
MKCYTYILFSEKLNKYYIGQNNNIENRIKQHNNQQEKYTKKGTP